jgi:hypothetical protein
VPPDVSASEPTHAALVEFFSGAGMPRPDIATKGMTRMDFVELGKAIHAANGQDCAARKVKNAHDVGAGLTLVD